MRVVCHDNTSIRHLSITYPAPVNTFQISNVARRCALDDPRPLPGTPSGRRLRLRARPRFQPDRLQEEEGGQYSSTPLPSPPLPSPPLPLYPRPLCCRRRCAVKLASSSRWTAVSARSLSCVRRSSP